MYFAVVHCRFTVGSLGFCRMSPTRTAIARGTCGTCETCGACETRDTCGTCRTCDAWPAVHVGPVGHIWGSPESLRKVPGRTQRRAVQALAELRAAVAFVRRHRLLVRVIAVETQNGSTLS